MKYLVDFSSERHCRHSVFNLKDLPVHTISGNQSRHGNKSVQPCQLRANIVVVLSE